MRINREIFGLHLIIIPGRTGRLPVSAVRELSTTTEHTARMFRFGFRAFHLREDHAHVLVTASAEDNIPAFINTLLERLRDEIMTLGGPFRGFSWDDAVHRRLLNSNLLRVILWILRAGVALICLITADSI